MARKVYVAGLSAGGTLSAWIAQNRTEVPRAVLIAPALIGLWRSKGLKKFAMVDFPKEMKIEHDMIDPAQKNQQIEIVYPVLVSLLNAP